jgi:hypothetical protein
MNGLNPTNVPKVWKPKLGVKKLGRNDLKRSNPCGNQVAHFVGYIKSLNAQNSCCNCKKIGTTSYARPTICISSINEGKTQVKWVINIGWKTQKWPQANIVLPMGPPIVYLILMKWLWDIHVGKLKKNTMGMGMDKIVKQMGKVDLKIWAKTIIFFKWLIVTLN